MLAQFVVDPRQLDIGRAQLLAETLVVISHFLAPECLFDVGAKQFVVPGFGQELVDCALVDGVGDRLQVGVPGKDNAHAVGMNILDAAQELHTGHAGHALIGDHHVDAVLAEQRQPCSALVALRTR